MKGYDPAAIPFLVKRVHGDPQTRYRDDPAATALVTQARNGDQGAWNEIVDRYAPLVWFIIQHYPLSRADIDDIGETVWLLLAKQFRNISQPAALPSWLATTTQRECLRVLRGADQLRTSQTAPNLRARARASVTGFSVRSLASFAAILAGREGPTLREEWKAHLAGESGHDAVGWAKLKQAAGFVKTGAGYRCSDWADAAWRPVDAVLRSRARSNLFVLIPTFVAAYLIFRHNGTIGVLTSFESIGMIGGLLYAVIKAGRKYLDVEPPKPKARQARKQDRGT